MTLVSGVELDYDGKKMPIDAAAQALKAARLRALIYTSPSYTDKAPKWRVLCPTSRDLHPMGRAKLAARVNGLFGGIFAPESFALSQAYFYGSVGGNPGHHAVVIDGDCVDLRDDLDAGALGKGAANGNPFTSLARRFQAACGCRAAACQHALRG